MKKLITGILVLMMMFSVSLFLVSCSEEKVGSTVLDKAFDIAEDGANEFADEAKNATADDVEDLKKDGNDLLSSLDTLEKDISDETDLTEEDKTKFLERVDGLRQKVTEGLSALDTK